MPLFLPFYSVSLSPAKKVQLRSLSDIPFGPVLPDWVKTLTIPTTLDKYLTMSMVSASVTSLPNYYTLDRKIEDQESILEKKSRMYKSGKHEKNSIHIFQELNTISTSKSSISRA